MSNELGDGLDRVHIGFAVLVALGAAVSPFAVSPVRGLVVFVLGLILAAVVVVLSRRWYGSFGGDGASVMGTEEWGYAGIIGALFLLAQKVMYAADPAYQLTGNVSPVFDVVMITLVGGVAAAVIFAGTWVMGRVPSKSGT